MTLLDVYLRGMTAEELESTDRVLRPWVYEDRGDVTAYGFRTGANYARLVPALVRRPRLLRALAHDWANGFAHMTDAERRRFRAGFLRGFRPVARARGFAGPPCRS